MLDKPLPEFDYEKLKPAGKFKEVLWELWALINGGVEALLVEKTDWAQVHRGTFTFQQGLLRDLREKMGYGTTEISIDNLVANPQFKERTRKSYGSAMSSFYAMVGVKDPSEAATVSKLPPSSSRITWPSGERMASMTTNGSPRGSRNDNSERIARLLTSTS